MTLQTNYVIMKRAIMKGLKKKVIMTNRRWWIVKETTKAMRNLTYHAVYRNNENNTEGLMNCPCTESEKLDKDDWQYRSNWNDKMIKQRSEHDNRWKRGRSHCSQGDISSLESVHHKAAFTEHQGKHNTWTSGKVLIWRKSGSSWLWVIGMRNKCKPLKRCKDAVNFLYLEPRTVWSCAT